MFSGLIGKPFGRETNNLVSAREVIESADSIAMLKKCRFKKVIIRGTDYAVERFLEAACPPKGGLLSRDPALASARTPNKF